MFVSAARIAESTRSVLVGGTARLASARKVAEARWVSPQEADDLTGGTIHEPVRRYLTEVTGLAPRCAPLPVSARQ